MVITQAVTKREEGINPKQITSHSQDAHTAPHPLDCGETL